REARILTFIGEARYWLGEYRSAVATLTKALEVCKDDLWTQAHACRFLGDLALNFEGDPDRAQVYFDQALAAARETKDPWTLARTRRHLGEAAATFRDLGARWELASALGEVGEVLRLMGDLPAAEKSFREALDLCRKLGERSLIDWTAGQLVRVYLAMGDR